MTEQKGKMLDSILKQLTAERMRVNELELLLDKIADIISQNLVTLSDLVDIEYLLTKHGWGGWFGTHERFLNRYKSWLNMVSPSEEVKSQIYEYLREIEKKLKSLSAKSYKKVELVFDEFCVQKEVLQDLGDDDGFEIFVLELPDNLLSLLEELE